LADEPDVAPGYSGNAHIKIGFVITHDDLQPQIITEKLGIRPDVAWAKGDMRAPFPHPAKFSHWKIVGEPNESLGIEDHIEPLLHRIEAFADRLKLLPPSVFLKIDVAVYFEEDDSPPGLFLEPQLMARMAHLGLHFEVSTYNHMPGGRGSTQ